MLPPVPPEVARLEQDVIVGGRTVSTGWWLRSPYQATMNLGDAETIFAQYFSTVMPTLLGLMHNEAECTTCRLLASGLRAESFAPPNAGAWTGATELAVASGLKWTTSRRGRHSW
jgi:hypothetical protein